MSYTVPEVVAGAEVMELVGRIEGDMVGTTLGVRVG
jgi:hypothetical protein